MTCARPNALLSLALAVALACTACDTNDGRRLEQPFDPLPATTTAAPPSIPDVDAIDAVDQSASPPTPTGLQLVAPWPNGGPIPIRYTCDGDDISPALTWSSVPQGTVELAVSVTDIDAGFEHWVLGGLAATTTGLVEGVAPAGSTVWTNDFGQQTYRGPCPPEGANAHRYVFTVHALNQQLELADDAQATEVIALLNQTVIEQSSVSGTYARTG
jgi:Raf kinase inhibitor-like YbhB/YbcL family protein